MRPALAVAVSARADVLHLRLCVMEKGIVDAAETGVRGGRHAVADGAESVHPFKLFVADDAVAVLRTRTDRDDRRVHWAVRVGHELEPCGRVGGVVLRRPPLPGLSGNVSIFQKSSHCFRTLSAPGSTDCGTPGRLHGQLKWPWRDAFWNRLEHHEIPARLVPKADGAVKNKLVMASTSTVFLISTHEHPTRPRNRRLHPHSHSVPGQGAPAHTPRPNSMHGAKVLRSLPHMSRKPSPSLRKSMEGSLGSIQSARRTRCRAGRLSICGLCRTAWAGASARTLQRHASGLAAATGVKELTIDAEPFYMLVAHGVSVSSMRLWIKILRANGRKCCWPRPWSETEPQAG
ncbi:protein of unknown function [Cupriavidus neocaledonicus]|uniref:Uncharacterized protein n=1 Tax=Cupriavidus neocaledonicus TaxID=1040979 RepID=A0A375H8J0_9BURK|nr:hypothetical protein CBM2605_A140089 [Cupriavidus neocaledonicus]SPD46773.1 protein of unknown function [Cupriavidus neocaledonicus]